MLAVARGIKDRDSRHPHTVELNYEVSGSRDDDRWVPVIDLSAAYTYYPPYAEVLKEYNRRPAQPVVLIESDYEFERDSTPRPAPITAIGSTTQLPQPRNGIADGIASSSATRPMRMESALSMCLI